VYSSSLGTVSPIVTPTANTTYSVVGTSSLGCVSATPVIATVSVAPIPTISVNSGSLCVGQSFTLIPSGGSSYTVTGAPSTIIGTVAIVSPTVTSSYTVVGTNTVGCASSNTVVTTLTVFTNPTITISNYTICAGQTTTLVPSGASTYSYTGGSNVVTPSVTTSYSVTGTSTAGCISPTAAVSNVLVNASPTISANSASICQGASVAITPTGASTYSITGNQFTVSPINTTTYGVTGTGTNGCVSQNTAVSTITVQLTPSITVNSGSICAGAVFTMIPGGASTYTYSSGTNTVSPSVNSFYTVIGTSSVGCVSTGSAVSNVTVLAVPSLSINSGVICSGQSFTFTPSGANTYSITGNNFTVTREHSCCGGYYYGKCFSNY
jgi:hypothetical protein